MPGLRRQPTGFSLLILVVATICAAFLSARPMLFAEEASDGWRDAVETNRLVEDWLLQDIGPRASGCFTSNENADAKRRLIETVLEQIGPSEELKTRLAELVSQDATGNDPRWKALYIDACRQRRRERLAPLFDMYPRIVFTKHYNLGGSHYAYTENPTDAQLSERGGSNPDWRMGASLCLLEVDADGQTRFRTLHESKDGVIRDPDVSYDGDRIVFSKRNSAYEDDYHLYELNVESGDVRQLTFGDGFADDEPAYLPNGDIIFNSTRCMQIVDCWWTDVTNLYTCDRDGRFLRRLTFDQVHTNYPTVLEDGRVIYTRWDYNDRGQIYPQPLFVMNYDGTQQDGYYGNNSWFPTTVLHARGIPGTNKLVAVASGHHSHQRGKLILIDRSRGSEEASGATLIAPVRETPADRIDAYGQDGEQFQYPYPIDETHFLVTMDPYGSPNKAYDRPYGVYFLDVDGRRELLAWDATISCNQTVPLAARNRPTLKPSMVDYDKDTGVYYVQDVHLGPGLEGVERGVVKRLRVVALEFRAAGVGANGSGGPGGGALSSTPVSINNGTWDVKRVLGSVPVEEDGSVQFEVPSRTPVYFQLLDEKGYVVQSMRSWSTLQPGERFSCLGCHEGGNDALPPGVGRITLAMRGGPKPLEPFHGPARGFSFAKEIQPILDKHCIECHKGGKLEDGADAPMSLLSKDVPDVNSGRVWSEAYVNLTKNGKPNETVQWLNVQSVPTMLPPYYAGAAKSRLMTMLEEGHEDVELSRRETELLACWIDLLVPFCGDYREANAWNAHQTAEYDYYECKRNRMAEIEAANIESLLFTLEGDPPPTTWQTFDAGGPKAKEAFIKAALEKNK